ncbi:biotin/lipoyl-binding protein [Variovorax defluvii]|uniref:Biotin carboxyl carrier protein of acetyl-CoA carboxylase n=1 Tax=Variovorax defluvii TaxID=913761 RepID=A0ABP8I114_9BURK
MKSIADLSQTEVERILDIVDRLNDIEVRLEVGDMKLHVRKFGDPSLACAGTSHFSPAQAPQPAQPAPMPAPQAAASAPPEQAAPARPAAKPAAASGTSAEAGLVDVRAPMLGRFYRASSPSEPAYVDVGSKVRAEDTIGVMEVMKLFNTVPAGVNGTVVEIVAENGSMVEHDAVLVRVRPE